MDDETAFWEERGEGAAATLGKFANDLGLQRCRGANSVLNHDRS